MIDAPTRSETTERAVAFVAAHRQLAEVLGSSLAEHLNDPEQGLRELARVTSQHLLVSVPREPIFRGCNLVTGRYVKDLGNTPGHFNHWSTRSFVRFLSQVGTVRAVSKPFPWTVAWVRLGN